MSAYKDALAIDTGASDQRLALAAEILAEGGGVVLFDGIVALRRTGNEVRCEVVDTMPTAHRCAVEYEVLVENARLALEASELDALVPDLPRTWLVVNGFGTGAVELWCAAAEPAR